MKAGEPHPDIGTVEALRAALLAAPSVAYSRSGASGIADAVNARPRVIEAGFTAELAVRGEAARRRWPCSR